MSRYSYIYSQIWTDRKFSGLSEDDKVLFLYLLSSPHSNIAGYYRLPVTYAASDLGWAPERFEAGMERLKSCRMALYDTENAVVLVLNFLKYNRIQNEKQAKGALKQIMEAPPSHLIREMYDLWKRLVAPSEGVPARLEGDFINYMASQGYPYAIEEQVQNTETEEGTETEERVTHREQVDRHFEIFWEAYPKKNDKRSARKAFSKLFPSGRSEETYERTLAGISDRLGEYLEELLRLKVEPRYVKNPASWLNAQEFEDGS